MKAKFHQNLKQYLVEVNETVYQFLEENVTPYSRFCEAHGEPIRIAPKNIRDYMSYIYWCKANDLIALGGESDRNELEAYYIAVENFIAWDRHKFFCHVLDNDTD